MLWDQFVNGAWVQFINEDKALGMNLLFSTGPNSSKHNAAGFLLADVARVQVKVEEKVHLDWRLQKFVKAGIWLRFTYRLMWTVEACVTFCILYLIVTTELSFHLVSRGPTHKSLPYVQPRETFRSIFTDAYFQTTFHWLQLNCTWGRVHICRTLTVLWTNWGEIYSR